MPPVSVLLNAIEEAQGELINYIDPNNPKRRGHHRQANPDPEVLDAMVMMGWMPPRHRANARKPPAPSA
jgi:hypothetical protein